MNLSFKKIKGTLFLLENRLFNQMLHSLPANSTRLQGLDLRIRQPELYQILRQPVRDFALPEISILRIVGLVRFLGKAL